MLFAFAALQAPAGRNAWHIANSQRVSGISRLWQRVQAQYTRHHTFHLNLLALPLPVIASFASVGVCNATGIPRCAAASMASPAACAVPSTVLRFDCANTRSMDTASGMRSDPFFGQAVVDGQQTQILGDIR